MKLHKFSEMSPFDLVAAKLGAPIATRCGIPAKFHKHIGDRIQVILNNDYDGDWIMTVDIQGRFMLDETYHEYDLFMLGDAHK
jgi:hypothetical protein